MPDQATQTEQETQYKKCRNEVYISDGVYAQCWEMGFPYECYDCQQAEYSDSEIDE
jgi:hypothetical protein